MSSKNYLSYDEQFKDVLNQDEISRIEDLEIRKIREKYWHLHREAFLDLNNILDKDLEKVVNELCLAEQKELQKYRQDGLVIRHY